MTEVQELCPFTGLPVASEIKRTQYTTYYQIVIIDKPIILEIENRSYKKVKSDLDLVRPFRHIIIGLLNDGKIQTKDVLFHWDNPSVTKATIGAIDLKKEIETAIYPRTPKEKLEYLFFKLHAHQNYNGESIILPILDFSSWTTWYFTNREEFKFFLQAISAQGYIDFSVTAGNLHYNFTYDGLNAYIKLFEEGYNSKKCFVAMSFQKGMEDIREAIRAAISKTGFDPIIIDERHNPSDKTINDEIFSGIKECKFCIADFTGHRNGVYFESGFAIGKGKPVIYTCEKKEFENAHFDIKPLQHIVYETSTELEDKLIKKINAWIK